MAELPISLSNLQVTAGSPAMPVNVASEQHDAESTFCQTLPPALVEARRAFQRDLPRLLRECPHQWVAYADTGMVAGPDPTKHLLYQRCLQMGLLPGTFLLLAVTATSGHFLLDASL